MTKQQKELLLKDLCVRVSNGVICSIYREDDEGFGWRDAECKGYFQTNHGYEFYFEDVVVVDNIENIKPYLRPIPSMTADELNEYENFITNEKDDQLRFCNELVFYNIHHFDYHGLIAKGLALEAPEGMYKDE